MESKIVNHWGRWVDSNIPITGVINSNAIAWEWVNNEICLDCEKQVKEHYKHGEQSDYISTCPNCLECDSFCLDWMECDSQHTKIIGDWILDTKTGQWSPDINGEYSAIVGEIYIQVVYSKTVKLCALCSPCYPGQGDLDSTGDFKAYTLPAYLTSESNE